MDGAIKSHSQSPFIVCTVTSQQTFKNADSCKALLTNATREITRTEILEQEQWLYLCSYLRTISKLKLYTQNKPSKFIPSVNPGFIASYGVSHDFRVA